MTLKDLTEGQFIQLTINIENETSQSYYNIVKDEKNNLCLKLFDSEKFPSNKNNELIANSNFFNKLNLSNLEKIEEDDLIKMVLENKINDESINLNEKNINLAIEDFTEKFNEITKNNNNVSEEFNKIENIMEYFEEIFPEEKNEIEETENIIEFIENINSENNKEIFKNENEKENNKIIPDSVQTQAEKYLGKKINEKTYKKYLSSMIEKFLEIQNENKWNCTKEEKEILLKIKEFKDSNKIEKLDTNNISPLFETEFYENNKQIIGNLYNIVYTKKEERNNDFHFIKNNENRKFEENNSIIPEKVQKQAKEKLNKELTDALYIKYFTLMMEDFLKNENKLKFSEKEKDILSKIENYKEENQIEKLDNKTISTFINTDYYKNNKEIIGNMYNKFYTKKTDNNKKEKKQETRLVKYDNKSEQNKNFILEAVKQNKLPFMIPQNNVNYITNPINNNLYTGYNQLLLQTNNNMNNLTSNEYISINDVYKNGGKLNNNIKIKGQIIENGFNNNGQKVYNIVVPVDSTLKLNKEQKKLRKEEYKRNIFNAKMLRDYGHIPTFSTNLSWSIQQPLISQQVNLETNNIKIENINSLNIEQVISNDTKNLLISSLAKQPYQPTIDYTNHIYKPMLENYINENPNGLEKMTNKAYKEILNEVKNQLDKLNSIQNITNNNEAKKTSKKR